MSDPDEAEISDDDIDMFEDDPTIPTESLAAIGPVLTVRTIKNRSRSAADCGFDQADPDLRIIAVTG